jgi:hypothetical protein
LSKAPETSSRRRLGTWPQPLFHALKILLRMWCTACSVDRPLLTIGVTPNAWLASSPHAHRHSTRASQWRAGSAKSRRARRTRQTSKPLAIMSSCPSQASYNSHTLRWEEAGRLTRTLVLCSKNWPTPPAEPGTPEEPVAAEVWSLLQSIRRHVDTHLDLHTVIN